ncbi:hypothetical protein C8Q77DRAFT_1046976 [Trametes polyzona]|nr:hypothetical protein C8Q77DRAFT_1046976 [Trametes polyzona]
MLRNVHATVDVVKRRLPSAIRLASTTAPEKTAYSRKLLLPKFPDSGASSSQFLPGHKSRKGKAKEKNDDPNSPPTKHLLKPFQLSARLNALCAGGRLDEAVEYLYNTPRDAQNNAVWNTLITHAGNAKRFRMVFDIYIEMKRRGFKPTLRTFGSVMGAFAKVDSWEGRHKVFRSVHKVYEDYLEYVATAKEHNPDSPEISPGPVSAFITICSKAGDYKTAFDAYNSLDEEGPFSPNIVTYTGMFRMMYRRASARDGESEEDIKIRERCASDARLVWRQMVKRIENGAKIPVDAIVISSVIQALAFGRPADHIAAFDIIRDYVGLAKPGETAPPPKVTLSPPLVQDILWLCNRAQKYRLCVHYIQHLMETNPDVLDRGHFDHVLTAYGSLSAMGSLTEAARALQKLEWMLEREAIAKDGWRVHPGLSTYTLVLIACWRAKDWESALRTFELMTGYRGEDFADGASGTPRPPKRGAIAPDAASMASFVRTALEAGDPAAMRQCARIVSRLGVGAVLSAEAEDEHGSHRAGARFQRDHAFYAHKTAQAIVDLVDVLVPKKTEGSKPLSAEEREWVNTRSEARTFLIEQRKDRPKGTPQMEEQPLGSAKGLAAMDSVVEWDLIHREQKSAR